MGVSGFFYWAKKSAGDPKQTHLYNSRFLIAEGKLFPDVWKSPYFSP
jgi:hypothetical protein